MLVHDPRRAERGRVRLLHCRARVSSAPGRPIAPLEELRVEFGTTTQLFLVGPGSCAVPGVAVGVYEAHRRAGRLPWARAGRSPRSGSRARAPRSIAARPTCMRSSTRSCAGDRPRPRSSGRRAGCSSRATRCGTSGSPTTLERYAEHGRREFSTGETARVIAESQAAEGGPLTAPRPRATTA